MKTVTPQLVADVTMYPTEKGGRRSIAFPGWGCPCMVSKTIPLVGYDAWPLLGDVPMKPGDRRRLGFWFLSEDGAATIKRARSFFLWEGHFVGEATVVEPPKSAQEQ